MYHIKVKALERVGAGKKKNKSWKGGRKNREVK